MRLGVAFPLFLKGPCLNQYDRLDLERVYIIKPPLAMPGR